MVIAQNMPGRRVTDTHPFLKILFRRQAEGYNGRRQKPPRNKSLFASFSSEKEGSSCALRKSSEKIFVGPR
jgi:hypothetical protein